jgi:octaprenyl-diphosphate synthase
MNDAYAQLKVAFLKELPAINAAIQKEIDALHPLVRPVAAHVMDAGGKRLRPMLTVLFARALGFRENDLHTLASALEFLHSATLMHDDILDNADTRRGRPAAHTEFGLTPTILAGDALLALANEIVARTGNAALTTCISQAIIQTATGEIMEIAAVRNAGISRAEYIEIITGKTAYLIQSACEFGVIAAGASERQRAAARAFGLNLGIAFQLVDDAMDYTSGAATSGKPLGGDLREGKFTLPLLFYIESLPEAERGDTIRKLTDADLAPAEQDRIISEVVTSGFADRTRDEAKSYLALASQALDVLPVCLEKTLLGAMIDFVLTRDK